MKVPIYSCEQYLTSGAHLGGPWPPRWVPDGREVFHWVVVIDRQLGSSDCSNYLSTTDGPQGPVSMKRPSFPVWDFHYKDKTVVRPSYLYNGNLCTGKPASSYWNGPWSTLLIDCLSRYFPNNTRLLALSQYPQPHPPSVPVKSDWRYTERCRYNAVNCLQNIHEIQPKARQSGRGMICVLWVQPLIDILPQLLQRCMKYHGIHYYTAL